MARTWLNRSRRAVTLGIITAAAGAALWWVRRAGGPDALAVQLASAPDAFKRLFAADQQGTVDQLRSAVRPDYAFIPAYVASLCCWVQATGRTRPLGRWPMRLVVCSVAIVAGVADVLENLATTSALDDLEAGRPIDSARITTMALTKWTALVLVGAYLALRTLGTPRRVKTTREPSNPYRLDGGRDREIDAHLKASTARLRAPDAGYESPGLKQQLQGQSAVKATTSLKNWILDHTTRPVARFGRRARERSRFIQAVWSAATDPVGTSTLKRPLDYLLSDESHEVTVPDADLQPALETPGAIGVSCSGGGIRSASFTLGALQVLREQGVLARTSHVTAVSGGGYMAAGWAIAASRQPDAAEEVYAPSSPEERWLRHHTNLLPDMKTALAGIGRALFGMSLNLVLIWLLIVVVTRPAGWVLNATQPELRGREPYVQIDQQPKVTTVDTQAPEVPELTITAVEDPDAECGCGAQRAWTVAPSFSEPGIETWTNASRKDRSKDLSIGTAPPDPTTAQPEPVVAQPAVLIEPALVVQRSGELRVVRQPNATVNPRFLPKVDHPSESADPAIASLFVNRQPKLELVDASVPAGPPHATQFTVTAPTLDQRSGTTGRKALSISGRMWFATGIAIGAFALVALVRSAWRPVRRTGEKVFDLLGSLTGIAAATSLGLFVVLPWIAYTVPSALARAANALPGPAVGAAQSSSAAAALTAGGAGVLGVTTIIRAARGPVLQLARRWPLTIAKFAILVVLIVVPFVLASNSLAMAAANGPGGHLTGLWASHLKLPVLVLRPLPDIGRWFLAIGVLVAWRFLNEAHALSLFPFYKKRMSEAFAVERRSDIEAKPVPYNVELAWTDIDDPDLPAKGHSRFHLDDRGPQLILCASVNSYGTGEAPSGRRSSPFTLSAETIGGPAVGYLRSADYLKKLSLGRRKDLTIPASLAIAGAAFSPGMGKMSMGSIDNLLAITNARLGVWIPHPAYVAAFDASKGRRWRDKPGWPWFIRELTGQFRTTTPYLYVTDGGHWENLGMVELLRRGCRNVVVISAAGDGAESFSTIGEAVALAREELQLEICIDLRPLRPDSSPPPPPEAETLRRGEHHAPMPTAAQGFARGVIRDLLDPDPGNEWGTIVILEANLALPMPWDVASWAEGHPIFPDDPTTDQNFNHRQFESYRRLGRLQMLEALGNAEVRTDLAVPAGVRSGEPSAASGSPENPRP